MFIPDPYSFIPDPGSGSKFKNFSFFIQKIVSELSEIRSEVLIPNPDLDFLPIPDPGVKKAPDLGAGTLQ
jgi:hypothetical protein